MSTFKYIIILVVLLILLGLIYPFSKSAQNTLNDYVSDDQENVTDVPSPTVPPGEEVVFCTMDAMMCPDGTYVGRSGPNCEFVCPSPGESDAGGAASGTSLYEEFTIGLNESKIIGDTTITALTVMEDSRCPSDVVCVQAGKVVVALKLVTPVRNFIAEVESGKAVTTDSLSITLDEVAPYPVSSKKTQDSEYKFKFNVRGR